MSKLPLQQLLQTLKPLLLLLLLQPVSVVAVTLARNNEDRFKQQRDANNNMDSLFEPPQGTTSEPISWERWREESMRSEDIGKYFPTVRPPVTRTQRHFASMKGQKASKDSTDSGDSSSCRCESKTVFVNSGFGVKIIDNMNSLRQIAHTMNEGSMVYVKGSKSLLLKTGFIDNAWIFVNVASNNGSREYRISIPSTFAPSTEATPTGPPASGVVTGAKLRLIALPEQYTGSVKYKGATSVLGGDYACNEAAKKQFKTAPKPRFRVLLNGLYGSIDALVQKQYRFNVSIVNLRNQKLFNSFAEMLNIGKWNRTVPMLDFTDRNIANWPAFYGNAPILAWQGKRSRDALNYSSNCIGFGSSSAADVGSCSNIGNFSLFDSHQITCNSALIVLCIESEPSFH